MTDSSLHEKMDVNNALARPPSKNHSGIQFFEIQQVTFLPYLSQLPNSKHLRCPPRERDSTQRAIADNMEETETPQTAIDNGRRDCEIQVKLLAKKNDTLATEFAQCVKNAPPRLLIDMLKYLDTHGEVTRMQRLCFNLQMDVRQKEIIQDMSVKYQATCDEIYEESEKELKDVKAQCRLALKRQQKDIIAQHEKELQDLKEKNRQLRAEVEEVTAQKTEAESDARAARFEKATQISDLEEEIASLEDDRDRKQPLVDIGIAIRRRRMAAVWRESSYESKFARENRIKTKGNNAAHVDKIEADFAVFEADPENAAGDEKYFLRVYGVSTQCYKNYCSDKSRLSDLRNQILDIPKRSHNAHSMGQAYVLLRELELIHARSLAGKQGLKELPLFGQKVAEMAKVVEELHNVENEINPDSEGSPDSFHDPTCSCFSCGGNRYTFSTAAVLAQRPKARAGSESMSQCSG
ncbi:hypothetical protein VTL71DRAFT_8693 [Oculimacula yallundae]|uniref:Uncharacterized protein n=1 Tax=Oculimacula yallundae TaxID=86028 RepID=A0ABR4CYB5_9HELO